MAAARQAEVPASDPVAVFHANRVQACTAAARAEGVHIGQRRRDAQSRCPELLVTQRRPGPGRRGVRAGRRRGGASRAGGGGAACGRGGVLRRAARPATSDPRPPPRNGSSTSSRRWTSSAASGVADTSRWRCWRRTARPHRAAGASRPRSARRCRSPTCPGTRRSRPPERAALTDLLIRLGIETCGAFAALPAGQGGHPVRRRRGAGAPAGAGPVRARAVPPADPGGPGRRPGVRPAAGPGGHRRVRRPGAGRAVPRRGSPTPGWPAPGWPSPPVTERGATLSRVWRCAARSPPPPPPTGSAGSSTAGSPQAGEQPGDDDDTGPGRSPCSGWSRWRRSVPGASSSGLWGSDGQDDQRAGWAFARVQGMLGPESVLSPVLSGGRGAGGPDHAVPWGDEKVSARDPAAPWPGALPAPSPARLAAADARRSPCCDDDRRPGAGHRPRPAHRRRPPGWASDADRRSIVAWAGPWVLDEQLVAGDRVTDPPRYRARLQLVAEGPTGGPRCWCASAGRAGSSRGCTTDGLEQPDRAVVRAGAGAVRPRRRSRDEDAPGGAVRRPRPGPSRASSRRPDPAPRAVRRAALPLRVQLPGRRVHPGAAGRRGGPARPGRAGDHRPRRPVRHRPVRRGGRARPACTPCTAPSCPSACPNRSSACPTRSASTCWCWPAGQEGYHRLSAADQPSPSCAGGEKGRPVYDLDELAAAAGRPLADPHRLPQGQRPARPGPRTARTPRRARSHALIERFGRRQRRRRADHRSCCPPTTRTTTPSPTLAAELRPAGRRHHRRALRHPGRRPAGRRDGRGPGPAQPGRGRPVPAGRDRGRTCGPARRWPRCSPGTRPRCPTAAAIGGSARSTCIWWRRSCRRTTCRPATTRTPGCGELTLAGAARRYGPPEAKARTPTRRSRTSWGSSPSSTSPATS